MTKEEMLGRFSTVISGMSRDHPVRAPICHLLHRDLCLDAKPGDGITNKQDHADLHELLQATTTYSIMGGAIRSEEELLTLGIIIGRRWGMIETSETLSMTDKELDDMFGAGGADDAA